LLLYVGYIKCQSSSQGLNILHITAQQYGEVVFPLFSQKSGMAHFLPSRPALTEP